MVLALIAFAILSFRIFGKKYRKTISVSSVDGGGCGCGNCGCGGGK